MKVNSISKFRTELMGIAAIMILICHANANCPSMPFLIKRILGLGNLGVDLFLFLSGVGLSYSLRKSEGKEDMMSWYKRRFIRLAVPYCIIMVPALLYLKISDSTDWSEILLHLSTISFWTRHVGAWFVAMLIPLYLTAPFLFKMINDKGNVLTGCVIALLFYVFSLPIFFGLSGDLLVIDNIQFCLRRTPAFIMGLTFFPYIKRGASIGWKTVAVISSFLLVISMVLVKIGVQYECPVLLLFPLMFMLIKLFESDLIPSFIHKIFNFIGIISLESYLCNVYIARPIHDFSNSFLKGSLSMEILVYSIIIIAGTLLAWMANLLCKRILSHE